MQNRQQEVIHQQATDAKAILRAPNRTAHLGCPAYGMSCPHLQREQEHRSAAGGEGYVFMMFSITGGSHGNSNHSFMCSYHAWQQGDRWGMPRGEIKAGGEARWQGRGQYYQGMGARHLGKY